jgi:alkylhydroperoxidase/carboxymuconolactone decarboxylase family protein YurZ
LPGQGLTPVCFPDAPLFPRGTFIYAHASSSPRTGVSDEEIDELLFQISAYCGVPAAVAARRGVKAVRAEREGA